jgi:hypothetical protein
MVTTISAAIWTSYSTLKFYFATPNLTSDRVVGAWVTALLALFLVFCALVLIKDGLAAIRKFSREKAPGKPATVPGAGGSAQ